MILPPARVFSGSLFPACSQPVPSLSVFVSDSVKYDHHLRGVCLQNTAVGLIPESDVRESEDLSVPLQGRLLEDSKVGSSDRKQREMTWMCRYLSDEEEPHYHQTTPSDPHSCRVPVLAQFPGIK